jgi:hypothetical protein
VPGHYPGREVVGRAVRRYNACIAVSVRPNQRLTSLHHLADGPAVSAPVRVEFHANGVGVQLIQIDLDLKRVMIGARLHLEPVEPEAWPTRRYSLAPVENPGTLRP